MSKMAGGTRRGFKFTTLSGGPVQTATIAYEEVEKETTTTPAEPKKRGRPPKADKSIGSSSKRLRDDEDDVEEVAAVKPKRGEAAAAASRGTKAAKPSSSSSSSSAASSSSSGKTSRAHYPSIPFSYTASGKNKPHAALLATVVTRACEAEAAGLADFFRSHPGAGRDALLEALKAVLDGLPAEVEKKCPADAVFEPEYAASERAEAEALLGVLATLQEQSSTLERYEGNMADFGRDYGLWLSSDQVKASSSSSSSSSSSGKRGQPALEGSAAAYDKLLEGMEAQCAALLKESSVVSAVVDEGRRVQERLYLGYNKVRLEVAAGPAVSVGTKDVMRNLQKK